MSANLKSTFIRIVIAICTSIFVCSIYAAEKSILEIQHWQTSNGSQVYFVRTTQLPMVDIQVVFDAGSARDGTNFGLAQFTNAMLNEGTATLSADQIANNFDSIGAVYTNAVNRDMATVGLRSLTDNKFLQPALTTFINVLTTSNFPQDSFLRTQKQLLSASEQSNQQPVSIAQNAFIKALYNNQPYAHPVLGIPKTVSSITPNDLQNFYKQYYVAKNALIAIVGNISKEQAMTIANNITHHLPTGVAPSPLPAATPSAKSAIDNITFPSQQTTVFLGEVGVNQMNPDYFPLIVGNYTLGGGILVSRLFQQVREQNGLVYGISSNFVPLMANGPFYIGLQTRNDQAQRAIELTKSILASFINHGPTEQELAAAKKNIIGSFPLSLASNTSILTQIITIGFYHLPLNYLDTYRDKVNQVTIAQIRKAFKKYINPDAMVLITVGQNNSALTKLAN